MEPIITLTAENVTTRIFNLKEAAEFLRVSIITVRRAVKSGALGSIKIGDRRLITLEQISAFVNANKVSQ